ncbi:Mss4-like protein [Xylariales sp. PMI_506]|nr:Mss4-like protein [Xylariales sp. PMI_506]
MPSGSCVCGTIAYEYSVEPAVTALCHCLDCQKWTGSGSSANVAIPTTEFRIIQGQPKSYARKGDSGLSHVHFFCGDCGSSLYSQPDSMEGTTLIKAGTLDNGAALHLPIKVEFFARSRPSFETPVAGANQLLTMS